MSSADQKFLGVKWDVAANYLVFGVQEIATLADVKDPMKRGVTNIVSKLYDPKGFL